MESLIGTEAAEQVRARLRAPTREPPLVHAEEWRLRKLLVYYGVLNEDPDGTGFPAAFHRLAEDVRSRLSPTRDLSEDAAQAVTEFARRWRLPRRHGPEDVLASLRWPSEWGPLRLRFGSRGYSTQAIGLPVVHLAEGDGDQIVVRERLPVIFPWVPLPFDYDPRVCPLPRLREHAEELAHAMVENIMEQGAALEWEAREQGWSPIPPRHQDLAELHRMALRLYRRAVAERSWQEIARAEYPPDPPNIKARAVPTRAVRDSIDGWAEALDIPLP